MDDLIVIILTLLFAVAGVIGQVKKKKQESIANPEQEADDGVMDFFDENIQYADEEPKHETLLDSIDQKNADYVFSAQREGKDAVINKRKTAKASVIKKKIKTKKFPFKKAIIYSEILHNKYT